MARTRTVCSWCCMLACPILLQLFSRWCAMRLSACAASVEKTRQGQLELHSHHAPPTTARLAPSAGLCLQQALSMWSSEVECGLAVLRDDSPATPSEQDHPGRRFGRQTLQHDLRVTGRVRMARGGCATVGPGSS